jgi:tricorn protease
VFEFEKEKETELGDVAGYRVSADQKKMLVRTGGDFAIVDLPTGKLDDRGQEAEPRRTCKVTLDRHAEWNQIYAECWRQMRDFFYAPNMHGVDWPAMRRATNLCWRMSSTAPISPTSLANDRRAERRPRLRGRRRHPKPERIPLGLARRRLSRDASGYYRVDRILRGQNWDPKYRSRSPRSA